MRPALRSGGSSDSNGWGTGSLSLLRHETIVRGKSVDDVSRVYGLSIDRLQQRRPLLRLGCIVAADQFDDIAIDCVPAMQMGLQDLEGGG
jgi:hypothetical protein